ncbi:MAG TPA: hypothetical protein VF516_35025 [Kofleriaceae bacterium]
MDLGDYRDDDRATWLGASDPLDERYLIDRAEHEAHAEGNEEEPDDPGEIEAPGNLTTSIPVPTLVELVDHLANMAYLWGSIAAMYGDNDPTARSYKTTSEEIRAEIQRRLDLVAERTGDDDGTTARIVEILNGRP